VANTLKECPNCDPRKEVRVIKYAFHTASKAKDDGFSNTGIDLNTVPQSKHRVVKTHLHY